MDPEQLFDITEAAARLRIPPSTLARKATLGEVPHRRVFRHIRFSLSDLAEIQQTRRPVRRPADTPLDDASTTRHDQGPAAGGNGRGTGPVPSPSSLPSRSGDASGATGVEPA